MYDLFEDGKLKCQNCGHKFYIAPFANWIAYCDSCHWSLCQSECGFGAVTPCRVYIGSKVVGLITKTNGVYRFDSDVFNLHLELQEVYQDALNKVMRLIPELLDKKD